MFALLFLYRSGIEVFMVVGNVMEIFRLNHR